MRKKGLGLVCLTLTAIPAAALANSSWRWFTKTRPHDLLPLAIILTVAIEIFALLRFGGVKGKKRAAVSVAAANLVSFLVPWVLEYDTFLYEHWNTVMDFDVFLSKTPNYQVTLAFLLLTLLFEIPVLYLLLSKHTESKKRLLLTAAGANTVTTLICAVMERTLCRGQW